MNIFLRQLFSLFLGYLVYVYIRLLSLNVRGLNSSRKWRQVFRWLHQQQSDIIFLQETYSSPESIKRWETEWGSKTVSSHGSPHSRGVMILFKPCLDVDLEKIAADNFGRSILAETIIGVANGPSETLGLAKFLSNFKGLAVSVL